METTQLLYMEDMTTLTGTATVRDVAMIDDRMTVFLDQTWFYPQGGGQPYDQGTIMSDDAVFQVQEVRFIPGSTSVKHMGVFEKGMFVPGQQVTLTVNVERRALMSRIHSAGHVIDVAVSRLGLPCTPGRGYHFPDGAFVEYNGDVSAHDPAVLKTKIQDLCATIIAEDSGIRLEFVSATEIKARGMAMPPGIPPEKPLRLVCLGTFCMPCGGTHVKSLKAIGAITIPKVSIKNGLMRVSYAVSL